MRKNGVRKFSYEDELVQRAANPRTGLITPFVQFDGTRDETPTDYFSSRRAAAPGLITGRRDSEDYRNIHDASWSSVDGLFASSDYFARDEQQVSPLAVGQRVDPMLRNVRWRSATTSDNMDIKQRMFPSGWPNLGLGIHDASRPAHQQYNPQNEDQPAVRGARSAMKKPNKIPRKEVGGSIASNSPSDLGLNDRTRAPQVPHLESDQAADGNAVRWQDTNEGWYEDLAQDRVLESTTQRIPRSQIGASRNDLTAATDYTSKQIPPKRPGPFGTTLPLNRYLPLVNLRHPSHFTNPEHANRDREARRLPPSLRSGSQKRRALEQTAIVGPMASAPPTKQRPRVQKQENHAMMLRSREERRDHGGYGWPIADSPSSRFTDSPPKRVAAAGQRSCDLGRNHGLTKVDEAVTEAEEVSMTVAPEWSEAEPSKGSTLKTEIIQESTAPLRSQDVGGSPIQDSTHAVETRTAHICIKTEKEDLSIAKEKQETEDRRVSKTEIEEPGICEPGKSQMDNDVRNPQADSNPVGAEEVVTEEASSSRPLSGFSQLQALDTLLQASGGDWSARSKKPSRVHRFAGLVGCHVASTLVRAMIAVRILGDPEARVRDYVTALRDIFLALVYLLAILHVLNLTRHLIAAVSALLFYAWHPFQAVVLVVRWFVGT